MHKTNWTKAHETQLFGIPRPVVSRCKINHMLGTQLVLANSSLYMILNTSGSKTFSPLIFSS